MEIELPLVKWKVTKLDVLLFWKDQDFDLKVNDIASKSVAFMKY